VRRLLAALAGAFAVVAATGPAPGDLAAPRLGARRDPAVVLTLGLAAVWYLSRRASVEAPRHESVEVTA
jgi:hypothetical protein